MRTATVQQLIEALQALSSENKALPVFTEGCDCTGAVAAVEVCPGPLMGGVTKYVELRRLTLDNHVPDAKKGGFLVWRLFRRGDSLRA